MQCDAHDGGMSKLLQLLLNIYPNINDDCMFKIDKFESTLCNKCGHTANTNGVCIVTSLHLEGSSNVQTISEMLHQLMDPREECLENYRCDGCQRLNTSTKAVYVTQLSGALIIQPNIFKFIGSINKKVIPNLSIDEEIVFSGNAMVLSGVIYYERQQSDCGNYASEGQMDNTWFFISDGFSLTVSRQKKFQCNSMDVSVSYILIYERRINLLMPPSSLLMDTAGILSSDSTPDIMIQQSVVIELEKPKTKLVLLRSKILL